MLCENRISSKERDICLTMSSLDELTKEYGHVFLYGDSFAFVGLKVPATASNFFKLFTDSSRNDIYRTEYKQFASDPMYKNDGFNEKDIWYEYVSNRGVHLGGSEGFYPEPKYSFIYCSQDMHFFIPIPNQFLEMNSLDDECNAIKLTHLPYVPQVMTEPTHPFENTEFGFFILFSSNSYYQRLEHEPRWKPINAGRI